MKLSIMQPYFFPYVGYYDLINRTDRFVAFDVVEYRPKSWMNRNRILHPSNGWQYMTVPVAHSRGEIIKDVGLVDKLNARRRIIGQLEHYRHSRAPFFQAAFDLVERAFESTETDSLRDLNVASLRVTCEYLGVAFDPIVLSEVPIALPQITGPGDWALEISTALQAKEYVNLPGGRELFDDAAFAARGIALTFVEPSDYRYCCGRYVFVEGLSIIDAIMWNAPTEIKAHLDSRLPGPRGVGCA